MITYGNNFAYAEADRRAKRKHGQACRCFDCIGRDAFVAETARLKAKHDSMKLPEPPERGYWMKLRQAR